MSETIVRYEPLPGRQATFSVLVSRPGAAPAVIGYIRLNDKLRWVARTLGSSRCAANICTFRDRDKAFIWLQGAVGGVRPRRRGAVPKAPVPRPHETEPGEAADD